MGKLSVILFGRNKEYKRASLSLKWHLNRGNFQDQVRDSFHPNEHESVGEVDTYQFDIIHINTQLKTATRYSIDDNSNTSALDISIDSIERDVSDNTLLGLLASGCNEPELYQLRTTMASTPPQTVVSDTQFWTYVDCAQSVVRSDEIFSFRPFYVVLNLICLAYKDIQMIIGMN